MMNFVRMAKAALKDQKGQGMVEYALILSAVAVAAGAAYTSLGGRIVTLINSILPAAS